METFLKKELGKSSIGHERRLEILFYLLLAKIRIFRVETPEIKKLFEQFSNELLGQISANLHMDFAHKR